MFSLCADPPSHSLEQLPRQAGRQASSSSSISWREGGCKKWHHFVNCRCTFWPSLTGSVILSCVNVGICKLERREVRGHPKQPPSPNWAAFCLWQGSMQLWRPVSDDEEPSASRPSPTILTALIIKTAFQTASLLHVLWNIARQGCSLSFHLKTPVVSP